jgi:Tfp pilus assembly protein PilO
MTNRGPIIAAVVFLLLAVLAFFFVLRPKMKEVDVAEQELEQAQGEEQILRAELSRLQQVEREAPRIRRELARLRKEIPPVADLPGLINILQSAADRSGVEFFSISPGDPTALGAVPAAEIPAQIQVAGSFFQIDEFLFRVEHLRRAAEVLSVSVGEGEGGFPSLTLNLEARFYTTDLDAGPGAGVAATPEPETSPTPGASPSPEASPTETPGV